MRQALHNREILVIENDPAIRERLVGVLTQANAIVATAQSAEDGLRQFYAHRYDLVILDVTLPGMDGLETCRRIRQLSDVPIVMLSALGGVEGVARGLDAGADDYVTIPFLNEVFLARTQAVMRRAILADAGRKLVSYRDHHLDVNLHLRQVSVRGEPIGLSPPEYSLLAYLVQNAGRALTIEQIIERVWGVAHVDSAQSVRAYIQRLRMKLEEDPANPKYLLREPGVGYRFQRRDHPQGGAPPHVEPAGSPQR